MSINDVPTSLTNLDLFQDLFEFIQSGHSIEETLKEYGGSNIYIPSYKTTCRNDDIIKEYKKNPSTATIRRLAKEHDVSMQHIYLITKHLREPSLF